MDSFETITIASSPGSETTSVPVSHEIGDTSRTFCVIAQRPFVNSQTEVESVPVDAEVFSTSRTFCVIA
ncbi:pheromone-like peptide [Fomitiporia mediterranea MF3/22]|uniref:pheromone-like peptide n=1 Tax=Fomitiporia mediterranea (strain MF3/22) TaxID=694068 RepID=UPI00044098ED|nr:pheromone-like peptide [Fomitiporia mediterranea MF3/22]EJD03448.1 pheromone-like peptide [Fomitiporia mediterranea MF3/22]